MDVTNDRIKTELTGDSSSLEKAIEKGKASLKGFEKATKDVAGATKAPANAFSVLANRAKSAAATIIKSFGRAAVSPFTKMGKSISGLGGKLWKIIQYRIIRGGLSKLTQSFEDGIKNIEAYDAALNKLSWSKASTLMSEMNANATVLKDSFASLGMTILARIMPVINAFTDAVVNAVNAVNMLISALSGRSGYTKALKYPKDYAEAASGAAKATRLWLGAFDEINRLDDNSGGGSSSALDYSKLFEESAISENFAGIQEAIKNGDWYGVGKAIADKLNEQIDSFDFHDAGARVGIKLRNAINSGLGFIQNFDFSNFGKKLSEKINGFIEYVDWNKAGQLLVGGIGGIVDFAAGFLGNLNWKAIGNGIGQFLSGALVSATEWIKSKDWSKATQNLFDIISGFVKGIDFASIWKSMWELAATLVQVGLGTLLIGFGTVFVTIGETLSDKGYAMPGKIFEGLGLGLQYWGDKILGGGEETAAKYEEGLDNGLFKAFKTVADWIDKIDGLFDRFDKWKENFNFSLSSNGWTTSLLSQWTNNWGASKTSTSSTTAETYSARTGNARPNALTPLKERVKEGLKSVLNDNISNLLFRANGGTVPTGDLFIANEAGPELVGSVGGRTTVTNQQQFTAGLEAANVNVVTAISRMTSILANAIENKDTNVYLDEMKVSRQLSGAMQRVNGYRGVNAVGGV